MEKRPLTIDTREAANHDEWFEDGNAAEFIPGTLAHQGWVPDKEFMEHGDFLIPLTNKINYEVPYLMVESKTWEDFWATVIDTGADRDDTRIRHQLHGLIGHMELGGAAALMTVGMLNPTPTGVSVKNGGRAQTRKWNYLSVMSSIMAIQHMGVMILSAPDHESVPRTLRMATEVIERPEHFYPTGLPRVGALAPRMDDLATTLTAVMGIGRETALTIAAYFHDFPTFYNADVKQLQEVKDVGPVLADRVHAHFHSTGGTPSPQSLPQLEKELAAQ